MFRTILHPTDLSEASLPALSTAHALAKQLGSSLTVCYIANPPLVATGHTVTNSTTDETKDIAAEVDSHQPLDPAAVIDQVTRIERAVVVRIEVDDADVALAVDVGHGHAGIGRIDLHGRDHVDARQVRIICIGDGGRGRQQVIKVVHDELVNLLGGESAALDFSGKGPAVILMVGLQGSGKTTFSGKLANYLKKKKRGKKKKEGRRESMKTTTRRRRRIRRSDDAPPTQKNANVVLINSRRRRGR